MDRRLLELLVCPLCKGPLVHVPDTPALACAADGLAFPVRDGIAVLLESEAQPWSPPAAGVRAVDSLDELK